MPVIHKPKYPVVDPDPSFGRIVSNFNLTDLSAIGAFTASGFAFGFLGARKQFRSANAKFLGGIGILAGIFYASQNSMHRFMGLESNTGEVKRFGAASPATVEAIYKKYNSPNSDMIDSSNP